MGTMGFSDLPVELLQLILQHVVIDDVFALRLTSVRLCLLLDASLETICFQVARNTFPRARLLFRKPAAGRYDFKWLKSLIPARLAAVVLDKDTCLPWRNPLSSRSRPGQDIYIDGLPAESDAADEVRSRVANGWRVMQLISNIYRDVYRLSGVDGPDCDLPWRELHSLVDIYGISRSETSRREHEVYTRAICLVDRLQPSDCMDFLLLFHPLVDAFRCTGLEECRYNWHWIDSRQILTRPYFFDCKTRPASSYHQFRQLGAEGRIVDDSCSYRHLDKGNAWLTSFILREGPSLFWEQWQRRPMTTAYQPREDTPRHRWLKPPSISDHDAHWIRDRIRNAWNKKTQPQAHIERECSSRIWFALYQRAHELPTAPPSDYDSLRNPMNNHRDIVAILEHAYSHRSRYQNVYKISESEWDWHEWQQGRIAIDGHAGFDHTRLSRYIHLAHNAAQPYYAHFDSLGDINYYIWL
ncbi:hypothetical protein BX600DRAFT_464783 [Xylariales sp. PMI_506]|nr:hypothetical protein BX600DRAFT_464783 [Xylariales sp. PMI_506]